MSRSQEINACFVCVNISCREWGSEALVEALRERLAGTDVQVKTHICFGNCWKGPNIVLYPEGTWYADAKLEDVDDIVAHVKGGPKAERLAQSVDPGLLELTLSLLDVGCNRAAAWNETRSRRPDGKLNQKGADDGRTAANNGASSVVAMSTKAFRSATSTSRRSSTPTCCGSRCFRARTSPDRGCGSATAAGVWRYISAWSPTRRPSRRTRGQEHEHGVRGDGPGRVPRAREGARRAVARAGRVHREQAAFHQRSGRQHAGVPASTLEGGRAGRRQSSRKSRPTPVRTSPTSTTPARARSRAATSGRSGTPCTCRKT